MIRRITQKAATLMRGDSLRSQLLRGSVGSTILKASGMLLGFLLALVLARILGPSGYGAYSFVLAWIMILAIPAQVGLPTLIVRETAKSHQSKNWSLMRGLWHWSNRYVFLFSAIMLSVGLALLWLAQDWLGPTRYSTFAVGLALVPLIALGNIRGAMLRGLGKVVVGQLPEFVLRPALIIILLLALYGATKLTDVTPATAMTIHAGAAFVAFICGAVLLHRARPREIGRVTQREYQKRYWVRAATPLALLAGLQLINQHTGIVMLGVMRSDSDVGIYRVVVQMATLVAFGLQACNMVLQPHFARLHHQNNVVQLQKLVTYSARAILLISVPPVLLMVLGGGPILDILFGEEYLAGAAALAILAIGQLINASMGSVGILLNMTGHERDTARGVAVAAVCNVLLNLLLIPAYGINGAALASAITVTTWNLVLWAFAKRRLGIETSAIGVKKWS